MSVISVQNYYQACPLTIDASDGSADEDVQVLLSEEKRNAIRQIQDPEVRGMLESAEIRAKKGEMLAEKARNSSQIGQQKAVRQV